MTFRLAPALMTEVPMGSCGIAASPGSRKGIKLEEAELEEAELEEAELEEAELEEAQLHEKQLRDTTDGPWNYFLMYTKGNSAKFEVLGVRSTHQMASMWVQMDRSHLT